MKQYCVYILSSKTKVLYIGVTGNLPRRIYEHKNKLIDGFTKKYNCTNLVYFEQTENVMSALEREKQLKKWRREKKINLIEKINPNWLDLADNL
ncbi:MAG: Excinuclease ABC subunit C [Candidatus Moranbacteria bacterium GW2011_GWE1_35_17]|nr:MAG: Excinuclease ABC subunit C [Candidatus Moranbacteria bacterium GW2011_GWE1_35_17]KKP82293.1 MAG: Excinuclease ABC subunit C [Candidatus Moranbacteria bacterium GW2011_GWF1_35_5]KKP82448.1 MAG: Excinuclease ABC subunit C [Candidatus Moranbacteria bacterium GW2011_GWF2_35_54]